MKTEIKICVEGPADCHPTQKEIDDIAKKLLWIFTGKFCECQEMVIKVQHFDV